MPAIPGALQVLGLAGLLVLSVSANALTRMSESEMASVAGKDGVRLGFDASSANDAITADEIRWTNDETLANEASLSMRDVSLDARGISFPVSVDMDVASANAGNTSDTPIARVFAEWEQLGFFVGAGNTSNPGLRLRDETGTLSAQSAGQIGFFSSGSLELANENGLFNANSDNARFDLRFSTDSEPGDFILRHGDAGSPEFSFGNANLTLTATNCVAANCTVGVDSNGLLLDFDEVDIDLNFDLLFKNNPTDFDRGVPSDPTDIGGRQELIKLGWTGGLSNFDVSVASGAVAGSEGLQVDTAFDYENDFALILGQAGVENPRAVFKSFQALGTPTEPEFSLPLTIDVVPGGTNLGSLCFGNTPTSACSGTGESLQPLTTDRAALAAQIRDGHVWVYNTLVDVVDPSATGAPDVVDGSPGDTNENSDGDDYETFNWSLGYTYGRFDANIAMYPGYDSNQDGTVDSSGLTTDVIFSIDSPGYWNKIQNQDPTAGNNWATNSHFFIADTSTAVDMDGDGTPGDQFGIGIFNADLLWDADNMGIYIASNSDTIFAGQDAQADIPTGGIPIGDFDDDGSYTDGGGGFWLVSPDGVRYQFRGMFSGGQLGDLSELVEISILDVRLDTDRFAFVLSPLNPPPGEPDAIGFEGLLDLNTNTYLSLAEPSNPGAAMRIDNMSGRIMWRNGKVQIRSAADNGGTEPSLTIANDLVIGSTASGGDELIGTVEFGGQDFGRAVVPGANIRSSISLKPK